VALAWGAVRLADMSAPEHLRAIQGRAGEDCLPLSSPWLGASSWKRAGHHYFPRRGLRTHRDRRTLDFGSWSRRSSAEAGSQRLRRAATDCDGTETKRRRRLQLGRSVCLLYTRRAAVLAVPWFRGAAWLDFSCHGGGVLELYRGQHAKAAVTPLPVVEDLQVLEDRVGQFAGVFQRRRSSSSTCIRDQNASIIELS
jgi:hypothetical protein